MSKICKHCGASIADEANFCTECGIKYEEENTGRKCPYCGAILQDGANFCTECGQSIVESTDTEQAQTNNGDTGINDTQEMPATGKPSTLKRVIGIGVVTAVIVLCALYYGIFDGTKDDTDVQTPYVETPTNETQSENNSTDTSEPKIEYASADLKLFGLKGHVKQCTLSGGSIGALQSPIVISFSKDGMLETVVSDGLPYTADYDTNGRIVELHDEYRNRSVRFTFDSSNRVQKEHGMSWYITDLEYIYEGGTLKSSKEETQDEQGKEVSVYTYSFSDFDEQGNWTLCEVSNETTLYKVINNEGDYEETEKRKGSYQVTCQITYYTPDEISALEAQQTRRNGDKTELIYRQKIGMIKAMVGNDDAVVMTQYALLDLDEDGNKEFFITDKDVWHTYVFTLLDGEVKLVTKEAGAIKCAYGRLLKYGLPSSTWGAVVYCALDNGNVMEGLTDENEKFSIGNNPCTKEKFYKLFSKYDGEERPLEWKPLSDFANE